MTLQFEVNNQSLYVKQPLVVSDTINYIDAQFTFLTDDWKNLTSIWSHFKKGETVYDVQLVDGVAANLPLSKGEWEVYLHGNITQTNSVIYRVTTEICPIQVVGTGVLSGQPFAPTPASAIETLEARLDALEESTVSATTLPAGSSATATKSVVGDHFNIVFGIPRGDRGYTGNGIDHIAKTGESGLVDTYTIYFTDGNTWSYTVSNGSISIEQTRGQNTQRVMSQKVVTDGLNALDDGVAAINSKIPTEATSTNKLADKTFVTNITNAIETDVDTIEGKIPSSATSSNKLTDKAYVDDAIDDVQDDVDTINGKIPSTASSSNKLTDKAYVDGEISDVQADIDTINSKIPTQASAQNQLADKNFVNSSIATETAHYISNNGEPFTSLAQLQAYTGVVTNNDYAFVTGLDEQGNTYYDRYKASVVSSVVTWAKEYRLNNSSFTAAQWSAISSGITQGKVQSYDGHLNRKDNPHEVTKAQVGLGNVDNTSDANKPISTATQSALDGKQASLVSGTNIKSVNSTSLLGSGNLDVGTIRTEDSAVGNPIPLGYVPEGGTTGQVLVKNSNADFDTTWQNASGGGHLYKHFVRLDYSPTTRFGDRVLATIEFYNSYASTYSSLADFCNAVFPQTNRIISASGWVFYNNGYYPIFGARYIKPTESTYRIDFYTGVYNSNQFLDLPPYITESNFESDVIQLTPIQIL